MGGGNSSAKAWRQGPAGQVCGTSILAWQELNEGGGERQGVVREVRRSRSQATGCAQSLDFIEDNGGSWGIEGRK